MKRLSHLDVGWFWALACLLSLFAAPASRAAEPAAKPAPPPAKTGADNPLVEDAPVNPLLEDDEPFVGTFKGQNMSVQIRMGNDGKLEGAVQKGTRSFPLTAKREGQTLTGHFTHNDNHFTFTATLEGKTLLFTSSDRLFKLAREETAGAAPPATSTVPSPLPNPPLPKPGEVEPAVEPALVPVFGGDALPKGAKLDAGRNWSGFPAGAYVVLEDEASVPGQIPLINRSVLQFQGVVDGKEMVLPSQFVGKKWEVLGKPIAWLPHGQKLTGLGYTAGKSATEAMQVDGREITCSTTVYSIDERKSGLSQPLQVKVWTTTHLSGPPQPMMLPQGLAILEGNVARIATIQGEGSRYQLDFSVASLRQALTIGQHSIDVTVYKGVEVAVTPAGPITTRYERAVSSQIPGGVARLYTERLRDGVTIAISKGTAIEMGLTKP